MENQQITVTEALERTVCVLNNIMVPAGFAEQIGMPILGCIGNLRQCIDAMNRAKPKEEEIPEIELVPVEEGEQNG